MKKIAIYGKGGIGKSTVTSNLSAALSIMGKRVMQIGCDPKADSTLHLTRGKPPVPVMEYLRENGVCSSLDEIVVRGFNGITCIESGGPVPGVGCAGRGILSAFSVLEDLKAFEVINPEFVFFDVLGDVVCGGFTMPLRQGWADEVYIVTSGEKMSLYAADNIKQALDTMAERGYARLRGIIGNCRGVPGEKEILEAFAGKLQTELVSLIPRDEGLAYWEDRDRTAVEGNPVSPIALEFGKLAERIMKKGGAA
jgi:nitrogenase iron protein NifH